MITNNTDPNRVVQLLSRPGAKELFAKAIDQRSPNDTTPITVSAEDLRTHIRGPVSREDVLIAQAVGKMLADMNPFVLQLMAHESAPVTNAKEVAAPKGTFVDGTQRVGNHDVQIWLPPGFHDSKANYPTLVMLDGENVFERHPMPGMPGWDVHSAIEDLTFAGQAKPAVVLAVHQGDTRIWDYGPTELETEYGKGGGAPAFLNYLETQLLPWARSSAAPTEGRLLDTPTETGIAGSSMGGLLSLNAMVSSQAFRRFGSFSPVLWWPASVPPPQGWKPSLDIAPQDTWVHQNVVQGKLPDDARLYLDCGNFDTWGRGDDKIANIALVDHLLDRGWQREGPAGLGQFKHWVGDAELGDTILVDHIESAWAQRFRAFAYAYLFPPS